MLALALGIGGMAAMSAASDRALGRIHAACLRFHGDNGAVHWSHGFPLALPLATLVLVTAGLVLAVVAVVGRGRPLAVRAVGVLLLAPTLFAVLVAVASLADFLSFPGPDLSSSMPPCGGG